MTRRVRLRVRSHACSVRRPPRTSSEIVGGDCQQFLAGFEQCGLAGILEERLNFRARLFGGTHGGPLKGRHEIAL